MMPYHNVLLTNEQIDEIIAELCKIKEHNNSCEKYRNGQQNESKPFKCTECDRSYRTGHGLTRHVNVTH